MSWPMGTETPQRRPAERIPPRIALALGQVQAPSSGKQIADDALLYIIDTKKIAIHMNISIYQSMFGSTNKAKFSSYITHLLIIGL